MHPKQYITTVLALIACVAYAAHAADKHGHDHDHRPLHGGIVAEAGDLNYELVARPDSLTIYVTDHGKPVAATGARGTATVHSANEKTTAVYSSIVNDNIAFHLNKGGTSIHTHSSPTL